MKIWAISLVLLVLLTGCEASSGIDRGMALRSALLQASSCTFDTKITADYGDKVYTFSMSCEADSMGNLSFCVTEPEPISGITGTVADTGGALTFDDTALYFALMADDQLSPVSAPWILLKTLRGGYLTSTCEEDGYLRLSIDDSYEEDALHLDIWLDGNDLPVRAEIVFHSRRILSLDVANFVIL